MQDKKLITNNVKPNSDANRFDKKAYVICHNTQESVKKMNEFVNSMMDEVKQAHRLALK